MTGAIAQGYLGAAYGDRSLPDGVPNENPDSPYDPNHPMDITSGCPTGPPT